MRYVLQINFQPCTNNMAEYEALLHGMRLAKEVASPQSPIPSRMAKQSELTKASSTASSRVCKFPWSEQQDVGLTSYPPYCGAYEQHPTGQRATLLSSWCMV